MPIAAKQLLRDARDAEQHVGVQLRCGSVETTGEQSEHLRASLGLQRYRSDQHRCDRG